MNYVSFSPLYVNLLTISGLFSLNKSTIELAKPLVSNLGPISAVALSQLELANQMLGQSMNKSQKSALSPAVKTLDGERDNFLGEIFRVSGSYLKSSDDNKKSAASIMQLYLAPYKGVASQPINIETGTVADMIVKYKASPALIAAAQTLDIDGVFDKLESKNTELNDIYNNRNNEYSERDLSASTVKPDAVTAYIQFCTALEQAYNYTPNDTITALFNKLDEFRKKYHALEGGKDAPSDNTPAK
ncbi:MAG: DUF6261 family protein [Paludibacter sp.]|nr:DUF6261 family protein [Paludibacter sp.]